MPESLIYDEHTSDSFLKLELSDPAIGFGASLYPKVLSTIMLKNASGKKFHLPNPPFIPLVKSISVTYTAENL